MIQKSGVCGQYSKWRDILKWKSLKTKVSEINYMYVIVFFKLADFKTYYLNY